MAELTDSFSRRQSGYVLVAAIDFGPTFSGYAFSFKSDKENIRTYSRWGSCVGIAQSFKTPTCVLTDKDGAFEAFGFEALHRFSDMTADEAAEYALFEKFMIHLHNKAVSNWYKMGGDASVHARNWVYLYHTSYIVMGVLYDESIQYKDTYIPFWTENLNNFEIGIYCIFSIYCNGRRHRPSALW